MLLPPCRPDNGSAKCGTIDVQSVPWSAQMSVWRTAGIGVLVFDSSAAPRADLSRSQSPVVWM